MKQVFSIIMLLPLALAAQNQDSVNRLSIDSLRHELEYADNKQREMELSGALGIFYNQAGKYDSARIYFNRALNLPGGREHEGGRLITNLANSYGFEGRYAEALKHYMEALRVSEQTAASAKGIYEPLGVSNRMMGQRNIFRTLANLAEVHYLTGNIKQALYYAESAKELWEEELAETAGGMAYIVPQILYVIGSVHLDRDDPDRAEEAMRGTYETAEAYCRITVRENGGNPSGMYMYIAYGKEGLARVSLARKDYGMALKHAAEALEYAGLHGDPNVTAKILSAFSDIHLAQGNYAESGRHAQTAMSLFPDYTKLNPEAAFNAAADKLFAGDRDEAYRYFRLYADRMKANADRQFRETMASMEIQFETEKKELRIADLERQNILYVFLGIACFILAVLIWIFLQQRIKNEQREKKLISANAILEWEKKERKRFASDLHDGINGMLTAIKFELETVENSQNIRNRLDNCIETIRSMARSKMPTSLGRYGLKASLEDYCRLFPGVDFHFYGEDRRVNEKVELTVYYCAYELVNNAFKHSGAKNINVQLVQDGSSVSLTVQDDGCGFDPQSAAEGSGLKNICDRVAYLNGRMDIDASPGNGAEINIELK
jgi:signal transduction histidine kinase